MYQEHLHKTLVLKITLDIQYQQMEHMLSYLIQMNLQQNHQQVIVDIIVKMKEQY